MKKLRFLYMVLFLLSICSGCDKSIPKKQKIESSKQVIIEGNQNQIMILELNNSIAAKSFYDQLPLTIEVENYGDNEKILYPPEKLDIKDTPLSKGAIDTIAYYEPWGDVVLFYGESEAADGLYELGEVISGRDHISQLNGTISIEKVDTIKQNEKGEHMRKIQLSIGEQRVTASLYDNETVQALLKRFPMTVTMKELHGNEKYYEFSEGLPQLQQHVSQIHTGDLYLYNDDCLVLFYKDFVTTFPYTKLGKIDDPTGLEQALGKTDVIVTFELLDTK